jgi:hypothetical protein
VLALNLPKKYDSMAIIICDSFKDEIDKRFREFSYKIDTSKYESYVLSETKFGEDSQLNIKPKTVKDFLNG